jgi:hypothetical protein
MRAALVKRPRWARIRTGGMSQIPDGLNAVELEKYLREHGTGRNPQ